MLKMFGWFSLFSFAKMSCGCSPWQPSLAGLHCSSLSLSEWGAGAGTRDWASGVSQISQSQAVDRGVTSVFTVHLFTSAMWWQAVTDQLITGLDPGLLSPRALYDTTQSQQSASKYRGLSASNNVEWTSSEWITLKTYIYSRMSQKCPINLC